MTACYLINGMPSSVLHGCTLYERLHRKLFPLARLRVFRLLCFATNLVNIDKFKPQAISSVLMGFSLIQNGYILLNLQTAVTFVSKEVRFHEYIFPFKTPATLHEVS